MLGGGNEGDGVQCMFEYNNFDRCSFESSDTGAFYTCGKSPRLVTLLLCLSFPHSECVIARMLALWLSFDGVFMLLM